MKAWTFITIWAHLPTDEIKIIWTWIAALRDGQSGDQLVPWYTSGFT